MQPWIGNIKQSSRLAHFQWIKEKAKVKTLPKCLKCGEGELVPLSDYAPGGAELLYKAWVCTNPACKFNLKIRNGEVSINEEVRDRDQEGRDS